MKIAKRVFLFILTNLLVVATISVVLSLFGVQPYLSQKGINFGSLIIFCAIWGFGGAFISLALSRVMAKWMMGVKVVKEDETDPQLRSLVQRVHDLSIRAGLEKMPEVGVYESPELNAFATGPSKNRSLVAVSTGLLQGMSRQEVEGVLAHEIAHIVNGDMVTMTLVQGVVNSFVMFLARVAGFFAGQLVDEEKRPMVQLFASIALEIVLGILGMMVVAYVSRRREYRADRGGADLSSRGHMIAALERLKVNYHTGNTEMNDRAGAIASLQISGRKGGLIRLFSTHPDLDDRINRLRANPL